jgi:hypothetical protein
MAGIETPEADYDLLMRKSAEPHQKKDKDGHYCYLEDKPENLNIQELRGYEPVTTSVADKAGGQSAKKLVKVGDLVLGRLPKEVHEKRQAALAAKTHRMRTNVRDQHRDDMRKAARQAGEKRDLSTGDIQTEVGRR